MTCLCMAGCHTVASGEYVSRGSFKLVSSPDRLVIDRYAPKLLEDENAKRICRDLDNECSAALCERVVEVETDLLSSSSMVARHGRNVSGELTRIAREARSYATSSCRSARAPARTPVWNTPLGAKRVRKIANQINCGWAKEQPYSDLCQKRWL